MIRKSEVKNEGRMINDGGKGECSRKWRGGFDCRYKLEESGKRERGLRVRGDVVMRDNSERVKEEQWNNNM